MSEKLNRQELLGAITTAILIGEESFTCHLGTVKLRSPQRAGTDTQKLSYARHAAVLAVHELEDNAK